MCYLLYYFFNSVELKNKRANRYLVMLYLNYCVVTIDGINIFRIFYGSLTDSIINLKKTETLNMKKGPKVMIEQSVFLWQK